MNEVQFEDDDSEDIFDGIGINDSRSSGSTRIKKRKKGKRSRSNSYSSDIVDYDKSKEMTVLDKMIQCFSIQQSVRIIFSNRANIQDRELESLNGIRVLALNSIILGNTFYYIL